MLTAASSWCDPLASDLVFYHAMRLDTGIDLILPAAFSACSPSLLVMESRNCLDSALNLSLESRILAAKIVLLPS